MTSNANVTLVRGIFLYKKGGMMSSFSAIIPQLIVDQHDSPLAGQLGVDKTLQRLRRAFY